MSDNPVDRRNFLKLIGASSAAIGLGTTAPQLIAQTKNGEIVSSPAENGPLLVEQLSGENLPYQYKPNVINQLGEKQTVFSRNVWDEERLKSISESENVSHKNLIENKGLLPNQTRLDYALMAASWFTASVHDRSCYQWEAHRSMVSGLGLTKLGQWDPSEIGMSWADASKAVKHAALFFGASLSGIAELNRLWLYSDYFSPTQEDRGKALPVLDEDDRFEQTEDAFYIPRSMNRVIVFAFEEDFYGISNSPGRLASAAVGDGYSRMAYTAGTFAEFIRGLGYRALPAGNGIGLSIPMAIDAGLGQLGRQGLLITPKFGPRVRIAKVITDMPLIADKPIDFGVTEFCETCMLCATHCPSGSVPESPQTWEGKSVSNNNGSYKWYVSPESCYDYNGFSCSNCKRVCPFTKPNNSWLHKMLRQIIETRINPLNRVLTRLDQACGYGQQLDATEFWKMNGDQSITSREPKV